MLQQSKRQEEIFKSKKEVTIAALQKLIIQFWSHHLKRDSKHRKGK